MVTTKDDFSGFKVTQLPAASGLKPNKGKSKKKVDFRKEAPVRLSTRARKAQEPLKEGDITDDGILLYKAIPQHVDPDTGKLIRKQWKCKCFCGKAFVTSNNCIVNRQTRSCGCKKSVTSKRNLRKANIAKNTQVVFGKRMTPDKAYKRFGLGKLPRAEYDRRRLEQGMSTQQALEMPYVRPAPPESQFAHMPPKMINVFGETLSVSEAIRKYGKFSRQTVYARIKEGESWEDALTLSKKAKKQKAVKPQTNTPAAASQTKSSTTAVKLSLPKLGVKLRGRKQQTKRRSTRRAK